MALYDPVNGVYRKVTKKYDPVDGVYRKVKAAYDPVSGVYRKYFSGGIPVSELAVGDSVWLNVNGVQTEFLVVHQGNPDSARYDESCDGTWLLMKNVYTNTNWSSSNNSYLDSSVHKYLRDTFLNKISSDIQSMIKEVKLPYVKGTAYYGTVQKLSDGMPTKIFLLSAREVGPAANTQNLSTMHTDGTCLEYFNGATAVDGRRIARNSSGSATAWYTRTPQRESTNTYVFIVSTVGAIGVNTITSGLYIRPAFILDSSTPIAQSDGKNIIE